MASSYVLSEPLHWLDLMDKHKVTHSWAPNFGFKLVADRLANLHDKDRKWESVITEIPDECRRAGYAAGG